MAAPMQVQPSTDSPAPSAVNGSSDAAAPNQTVYVHNLNEKMKLSDLKTNLYHLFSQHGSVLDIHARKTYKLRGQAWIIFNDVSSATKAVKEADGADFFGKKLNVSFAKAKSDVVSKADGSFVTRPKRKLESKGKGGGPNAKKRKIDVGDVKEEKHARSVPMTDVVVTPSYAPAAENLPNKILFVEGLPADATLQALTALYTPYTGFVEARIPSGRVGIAFVEFTDEYSASVARQATHHFRFSGNTTIRVSFSK